MLSHIVSDLHQTYLEEVFTPQLGKPGASTPAKPKSPNDLDNDGDVDSFEKKVRQFIYDVRHIMRKNNIPVEKAYQVKISGVKKYSSDVIQAAKEKLGIKSGSSSVSEESSDRMVTVTINYKNGTIDRRNVPYHEVSLLRKKPTISSVEVSSNVVSYPAGEKYEKKYGRGGKNTVGDAGRKDLAIKKSTSKRKRLKGYGMSESFSDWRQDLKEIVDEINSRKQNEIKEKNVNNYSGGKDSVVKINPEVAIEKTNILGGQIIESFELDESYFNQAINIATEFFYNYGLNENGVDIVIEELGEEKFTEFVFDLAEEYFLSEELKKSESNVKKSKAPKGTKQYASTIARIKKQGGTTMSSKHRIASTIPKDRFKKSVEKAKDEQNDNKPTLKSIGAKVAKGASEFSSGWKQATDPISSAATKAARAGLIKARKDIRTTGAALGRGFGTATAAKRSGETTTSAAAKGIVAGVKRLFNREDFENWVNNLLDEGYDLSDWTTEELYEEYGYLCEKAESEQQQKLFGLALSVKRGETPRSEVSAEVLKIVDTMSEKKIRDFAKTKHEGIPKKVDEAVSNPRGVGSRQRSPRTTGTQKDTQRMEVLKRMLDYARSRGMVGEDLQPQNQNQITARKLVLRAQRMRVTADQKALQQMQKQQMQNQKIPQNPQTQNASYELEGDMIDEASAAAKRGLPEPHRRSKTPQRVSDAAASLEAVKGRQKFINNYNKKTGRQIDISQTKESQQHAKNFPGSRQKPKPTPVSATKDTPEAEEVRKREESERVSSENRRTSKYGLTRRQAAMTDVIRSYGSLD